MIISSWVTHQLSERNKKERVECCPALIMLYQTYGFVLLASHLLVLDESWFYWVSSERREVWVERYTWILHRAAAGKQSDQNLAGKLFMGCLGEARRFPTQNRPRNTMPLTILAHSNGSRIN